CAPSCKNPKPAFNPDYRVTVRAEHFSRIGRGEARHAHHYRCNQGTRSNGKLVAMDLTTPCALKRLNRLKEGSMERESYEQGRDASDDHAHPATLGRSAPCIEALDNLLR